MSTDTVFLKNKFYVPLEKCLHLKYLYSIIYCTMKFLFLYDCIYFDKQ